MALLTLETYARPRHPRSSNTITRTVNRQCWESTLNELPDLPQVCDKLIDELARNTLPQTHVDERLKHVA
jgi:hypothetical protein